MEEIETILFELGLALSDFGVNKKYPRDEDFDIIRAGVTRLAITEWHKRYHISLEQLNCAAILLVRDLCKR